MTISVINDAAVRKAVASLVPRADRAEDLDTLVETFVDSGIIDLVDNPKNQVIYGRRGTGKTHLLGVLRSRFAANPGIAVVYLDVRTLGSSTLFTDIERPIHARFLGLYKDIVSQLHNSLFEYAMNATAGNVDGALNALDEVEKQMHFAEEQVETIRTKAGEEATTKTEAGLAAQVSLSTAAVSSTAGTAAAEARRWEQETGATSAPKIIFPALFDAFQRFIDQMNMTRFVILIDEWSSIPLDLQPHMAELLNRVFFAAPR